MSSKSIKTLTKQTYIDKNEQRLLKLSDARYYSEHFLLGQGVNRDEMVFSTIMSSFLCESNCELNNLIKDKIAGKLEPKKRKKNPIIIAKSEDGEDVTVVFNAENYWDSSVEW